MHGDTWEEPKDFFKRLRRQMAQDFLKDHKDLQEFIGRYALGLALGLRPDQAWELAWAKWENETWGHSGEE